MARWKRSIPLGGPTTAPVVLWLRQDLRLHDNPLLQHGLKLCGDDPLQLVVCLDPRDFGRSSFGSPKVSELRKRFLQESLLDLRQSLAQRGSRLLVRKKAPEEVLPQLVRKNSVVLVSAQVCSEERRAEQRVAQALAAKGARLEVIPAAGITDLVGARELVRAGVLTGEDFKQFPENFQRYFLALRPFLVEICNEGLSDAPEHLPPALDLDWDESHLTEAAAANDMVGGEKAGWERMLHWLDHGLENYKSTFRDLQGDYSSRLSAHLAYGCISPRRLVKEALSRQRHKPSVHVEHFVYEMCWRDFFRHTAARFGVRIFHLHGPLGAAEGAWRRDPDAERRWKEGTTGVPLVDAAMRELRTTGYIGNLARQYVAAFLIEDLQIDWRVGADWFEATLVDYDVHSNWGQWARSAGVVHTNEAKRNRVGGTRYYDLALQKPHAADYVRRWIPELAQTEDKELFAPWSQSWGAQGAYAKPLISTRLKHYFEGVSEGMVSRFLAMPSSPKRKGRGKSHQAMTGTVSAALSWATSNSEIHGRGDDSPAGWSR